MAATPRKRRGDALSAFGPRRRALSYAANDAFDKPEPSSTADAGWVLPTEVLRHGAYLLLGASEVSSQGATAEAVAGLADSLGLTNEVEPVPGGTDSTVAFLRRTEVTPRDLADEDLMGAAAVVHVASPQAGIVDRFCAGVAGLLGPAAAPALHTGVVRPLIYTGAAMHGFAYAHQVTQQSAGAMPNALLLPLKKTAAWWAKDWMERHTYLLPRYDDAGRMVSQGHALAAAPGIASLMRRTYQSLHLPARNGRYDFLTYFECADSALPIFHEVCAALRDVTRNPEWAYVREGPLWHGRRVGSWTELFA